jgi:hypothetical protein
MKNRILLLAIALFATAWADTILLEGSSLTRTVPIKAKDVVKVEAVDNTLTLVGNGDILHLDGSDNRVTVQGSLNGIVLTGSSNRLNVVGTLHQLDVRGCDNQITLDGDCRLIQYGGSDNQTTWIQRPGRKQPKIERTGWENQFKVSQP